MDHQREEGERGAELQGCGFGYRSVLGMVGFASLIASLFNFNLVDYPSSLSLWIALRDNTMRRQLGFATRLRPWSCLANVGGAGYGECPFLLY